MQDKHPVIPNTTDFSGWLEQFRQFDWSSHRIRRDLRITIDGPEVPDEEIILIAKQYHDVQPITGNQLITIRVNGIERWPVDQRNSPLHQASLRLDEQQTSDHPFPHTAPSRPNW